MKNFLPFLQQLGRALMLPIAVLPVAGLLLRLGQPDLLALPFIAGAGDAIFTNLGILFAIGVAVGLARENNGAAALAAVVGYFVATKGAEVLIQVPLDLVSPGNAHAGLVQAAYKSKEIAKLSVPIGILSGLIAGYLYNRYSAIKLPSYLAFFAGRRFVPIASGLVGLVLAVVFGLGWPIIEQGMDQLSYAVAESGRAGLFVYGVLNRFLIATGLHHILNNVAWFIIGDFNGATGDLKRFFAGDPTAGYFMSGFFPVMMFGLPAACLAMYHTALPERKKETAGLLLSMGLTSFLTGVTEPIEFTFMFLAPLLFALHALLTGTAMVAMDLLQTRLGFGFSAGLFDYLLNYKLAEKPLMLLPVGAVYFVLYYGLFRFFIQRFNILTPGRDALVQHAQTESGKMDDAGQALAFIRALGGADNLQSVDACTTRLRLQVVSLAVVNEPELKSLGAMGIVRLGQHGLQVVLGPVADQVAGDIRAQWQSKTQSRATRAGSPLSPETCQLPDAWCTALGGQDNVLSAHVLAGRIMVRLVNIGRIDEAALQRLGVKMHGQSGQGTLHLLHDEALQLCGK